VSPHKEIFYFAVKILRFDRSLAKLLDLWRVVEFFGKLCF